MASVKVAPEYRGQGAGRRLMTELLAAIAARGYPLAALYPVTMPIYRSLGWELAGGRYRATIPARSLRDLLAPDAAVAARAGKEPAVRRAEATEAAEIVGIIGGAHEAARDCGPITWDVPLAERWLGRADMYTYRTLTATPPTAGTAPATTPCSWSTCTRPHRKASARSGR